LERAIKKGAVWTEIILTDIFCFSQQCSRKELGRHEQNNKEDEERSRE
jgi:hypothetical protein